MSAPNRGLDRVVYLRVDEELLNKVEQWRIDHERPGMPLSFAAAVRMLLHQALTPPKRRVAKTNSKR